MSKVLPRKHAFEVEPSMILRPRNPADHRQFEEVLPWFTPLFVWHDKNIDWVRWSVPKERAEQMGIAGGCACCGKNDRVEGDMGDYHVDTAWHETDWWLEANGYSNPGNVIGIDVDTYPTPQALAEEIPIQRPQLRPAKKKGEPS